jgi:transcriptional regulator with XRE-family HTH domain
MVETAVQQLQREIGERLARAMREADMDADELARLTGIGRDQIGDWLIGRGVMFPHEIVVLCKTLDLMPQRLLGFGP